MFERAKSAMSSFTSFFDSDEDETDNDEVRSTPRSHPTSGRYGNVPWNNERERAEYVSMFKPVR